MASILSGNRHPWDRVQEIMRKTAIGIGFAVVLKGAAPGRTANPVDVVAALVEKPPGVLSGLEAIVGPLHRNPGKWEEAVGPLRRVSPGPAVARAYVELAI